MYRDHLGNTLKAFRFQAHKDLYDVYQRGYRASKDGQIFGVRLKRALAAKPRRWVYPHVKVSFGGRHRHIKAHSLAAYMTFGFRMFEPGIVVRHLNGNKLDFSKRNIAIGTHRDNNLDKPQADRVKYARNARAAQGVSSPRAKLTPEQVRYIRDFYAQLPGNRAGNGKVQALCDKLGVSRRTLRNVAVGRVYQHVP